jgi:hypothetical protein
MNGTHQGWTDWDGFFEAVHKDLPELTRSGPGMKDVIARLGRVDKS